MTSFGWSEQTYLYSKFDIAIVIHKATPKTVTYSIFKYRGDITNLTYVRDKNNSFHHKITTRKPMFLSIFNQTPYKADKSVPNKSVQIYDDLLMIGHDTTGYSQDFYEGNPGMSKSQAYIF